MQKLVPGALPMLVLNASGIISSKALTDAALLKMVVTNASQKPGNIERKREQAE